MENRASFFARLEPAIPPAALLRIRLAYIVAKGGHRHQVRSELDEAGVPIRYFEHPRAATLILIDELEIIDPELICADLLHDGPEDTHDLTPELIEEFWGPAVAAMVMLVTNNGAGYEKRLLAYGDWKTLTVKLCDRLHNLRTIKAVSPARRARKLAETRELYYPLFARLLELAPPEYRPRLEAAVAEIHRIADAA
jgi:(p)ppGpp synthase/HD superfamily hydrolase